MVEDAADHARLGEGTDDAHHTLASGTDEGIDLVDSVDHPGPSAAKSGLGGDGGGAGRGEGAGQEVHGLEGLGGGVDEPGVADPLAGEDVQLLQTVEPGGRRREDLADPVGGQGEERLAREDREARLPPARYVGHRDVGAQVDFRLVDDPPAAGASPAADEGWAQLEA